MNYVLLILDKIFVIFYMLLFNNVNFVRFRKKEGNKLENIIAISD
jgi:hypothetical protein